MNLQKIDLRNLHDELKVCKNPHKGWYLHYYDNCLSNYGSRLEKGDFLEDFPCLNHIYLRLAWNYLQPEEKRYNWEVIEKVIEPWVAHGYNVSFRITCKETDPDNIYATPEWLVKKGAKGELVHSPYGGPAHWEPDYGDPIFLEYLEQFHCIFAERYGNKLWLEYVDIGSYGDWGEGHTHSSSGRDWPLDVIKKHIDIHCKYYKNNIIMINDDFMGNRRVNDGSTDEILRYSLEKGLALRDDSLCVEYYADRYGFSTLRSPQLFNLFWRSRPTDLELEHYHMAIEENAWKGGYPYAAAVEEAHATFMGFHGFAREWLKDNPDISKRLANKAGYWYFLNSMEVPSYLKRGEKNAMKLHWENKGTAPSYYKYKLILMLQDIQNGDERYSFVQEFSDNRTWFPGVISTETCIFDLPVEMKRGQYRLKIAIFDESGLSKKSIELSFTDCLKDRDNFYDLLYINVD